MQHAEEDGSESHRHAGQAGRAGPTAASTKVHAGQPPDGAASRESAAAARAAAKAEAKADAALIAGMRRGEEKAFAALYERFTPMLRQIARRVGGDLAAEQMATDVLTDVATRLIERADEAPLRLAAYLSAALVRQLAGVRRTSARRARLEAYAADDVGSTAERVLKDAISQYAVRSSAGEMHLDAYDPDGTLDLYSHGRDENRTTRETRVAAVDEARDDALAPALRALARALEATFTSAERDLATLLAAGLTQADVATALGISYGAARVRIHRLRRRLWTDAADVAARLPGPERAEVRRFLRRAHGGGHVIPMADAVHDAPPALDHAGPLPAAPDAAPAMLPESPLPPAPGGRADPLETPP
jgi:RNA polymerase sigma factor (sigma-70 family)